MSEFLLWLLTVFLQEVLLVIACTTTLSSAWSTLILINQAYRNILKKL